MRYLGNFCQITAVMRLIWIWKLSVFFKPGFHMTPTNHRLFVGNHWRRKWFRQTKDFTHEWSTTIELADCRRHMKTRPYNSPRIHILLIWLLFSLFFDSTDGSLAKLFTNSDNPDLYVKRKEFVFVDHRQWTMRGSSMTWTNSKEHGTHFNMLSVVFDFVNNAARCSI